MPNILFVTAYAPFPLSHGMSLRAVNLARSMGPEWNVHLAYCGEDAEKEAALANLGAFTGMVAMPEFRLPDSPLRVFRRDDRRLLTRFAQPFASRAIEVLERAVRDWSIDVVVGMNFMVSDLVCSLREGPLVIVDECDCRTLTMERAERRESSDWSLRQKLGRWATLSRIRRAEGALTEVCDLVTTVGPEDGRRLRELSTGSADVRVVPNGVGPEFLAAPPAYDRGSRSVAFWGNLDFDVNHEAVRHFHDEIYGPHLADRGVVWHVIGKSPGAAVVDMAERHEGIVLSGFVDDLAEHLADVPLMVNPMVMGSGLKNKVLEAFCMGIVVVSTSMGVEALEVENGVHCVIEDDPGRFADAVVGLLDDPERRVAMAKRARRLVEERYSWEQISGDFGRMLKDMLAGRAGD